MNHHGIAFILVTIHHHKVFTYAVCYLVHHYIVLCSPAMIGIIWKATLLWYSFEIKPESNVTMSLANPFSGVF